MKTRMPLDPGFHAWMFMRAIIIHDQMEVEFGRSFVIYSLKESQELLMPMAGHAVSDHLAVCEVLNWGTSYIMHLIPMH